MAPLAAHHNDINRKLNQVESVIRIRAQQRATLIWGNCSPRNRTFVTGHPRGAAPLEVVMVLPVLILVWLVIMQIGVCSIRQAEVTVLARGTAWSQRDGAGGEPFEFDGAADKDKIEKSATGSVKISGISAGFPEARSRHSVIAGSWAHPAIDLNQQPNFELAMRLARQGPSREAAGRIDDVENLIASMSKLKDAFSGLGSPSGLGSMLQGIANDTDFQELMGNATEQNLTEEIGNMVGTQIPELDAITGLWAQIQNKQGDIDTAKANASRKNAEEIDAGIRTVEPLTSLFDAKVQQKMAQLQMQLDSDAKSDPDLKNTETVRQLRDRLDEVKRMANEFFAASTRLKQQAAGLFQENGKPSANVAASTVRDHFVKRLPNLEQLQRDIETQIEDAEKHLADEKPEELQAELKKLAATTLQIGQKIQQTDRMLKELLNVLAKSKD